MLRAVVTLAILGSVALPAQELRDENLDKWLDYIQPNVDELDWQEIPWRSRLDHALLEAGEKGRPVLLWAMNGHPLGCT